MILEMNNILLQFSSMNPIKIPSVTEVFNKIMDYYLGELRKNNETEYFTKGQYVPALSVSLINFLYLIKVSYFGSKFSLYIKNSFWVTSLYYVFYDRCFANYKIYYFETESDCNHDFLSLPYNSFVFLEKKYSSLIIFFSLK